MPRTIGVLTNHVGGALRPYERAISRAVSQVLKGTDIHLTFYSGGFYRQSYRGGTQQNFVFDQVLSDKPDGLIVISSLLGEFIEAQEMYNFLSRFSGIPLVSAGMILPGIPSVNINNYQAMAEMVHHMVDFHGIRKFLYIDGPKENAEARQRFQAFENILSEKQIPSSNYHVLQGDFYKSSGRKAAEKIWGRKDIEFDAVISASDEMAFGFIEYMSEKGLSAPGDYLITGFDNIDNAEFFTPSLTTIDQNIFMLGRTSCELLIALLNGEEIDDLTWLPSTFKRGVTCGCQHPESFLVSRDIKEMSSSDKNFLNSQEKAFSQADLDGKFDILKYAMDETKSRDLNPRVVMQLINPMKDKDSLSYNMQEYWHFYSIILDEARIWKGAKALDFERQEGVIRHLSEFLLNTTTLEDLTKVLGEQLPKLAVKACSLCFLPADAMHGQLDLKISYIRNEGARFYKEPVRYQTTQLQHAAPHAIRVVESLDYQQQIIGLLIFEMEEIHYSLFGPIRELLSGTLHHIKNINRINTINNNLFTQVDRLQTLRTIDCAIMEHQTRKELLGILLREVKDQQKIDGVSILLFNKEDNSLEFAQSLGIHEELNRAEPLALGEGNAGKAASRREPIFIEDIRISEDFADFSLFHREGFVAYCAAPLVAHGKLKGVMELYHRTPLEVDQGWLNFLETLTGQVAIALENSFLIEDLKKANKGLLQSYRNTIEGWSRALDLRDHETEGHCLRVAKMSVEIGRMLNLNANDLEALYRGALLHDIGKMGIPDSILQKPGPLDDEERAIMNFHPQYAYDLLSPIDFLETSLPVPWCHHEKWDGSGYPQGLKEEEIPLFARIFAIIDVWDALSNKRPYRDPWPEDKIRKYIRSLSGSHFDPQLVEPFFQMIDRNDEWAKDIPETLSRYIVNE